MNRIIVGVDVGKNKVHLVAAPNTWCVATPTRDALKRNERDECLTQMSDNIYGFLNELVSDYPDKGIQLYVEDAIVAGARNIQTTIGIAHTVGMVLSMGFPATLVPVSTWKKAVVGKGNATKEEVRAWYESTGGTLEGQDLADAAAIRQYGVQVMEAAEQLPEG